MRRSVVQYVDLDAPPAETSAAGASRTHLLNVGKVANGRTTSGEQKHGSDFEQGNRHWSAQGDPISASAQRKYRALLNLLARDRVDAARQMLTTHPLALKNENVLAALEEAHERMQQNENEGAPPEDGFANDFSENTNGSAHGQTASHDASKDAAMDGDEGRQLSHAEIWDDSALVDAWDAAMQEYELFDKMRAEAAANPEARSSPHTNGKMSSSSKSALWHEAPAVGSSGALEARRAAQARQEDAEATRRAAAQDAQVLEARKAQARRLLDEVAGTDGGQVASNGIVNGQEVPPAKKRKQARGVVPPSSKTQGNAAWHLACATVSQTPNRIGGQPNPGSEEKKGNDLATKEVPIRADESPQATSKRSTSSEADEVLQNLAMSWYYAGYYQAMASAMMSGNGGGSAGPSDL